MAKKASTKALPRPAYRTSKAALAALRGGDLATSLPALEAFAAAGANEASAALAMVAAYRRDWETAIDHAARAFRTDGTIYAGNVWDDLATVLVRAARERGSFGRSLEAIPETAAHPNHARTVERLRRRLASENEGTSLARAPAPDAAERFAAAAARLDADPKLAKATENERARRRYKTAIACDALDEALRVFRAHPTAILFDDLLGVVSPLLASDGPEVVWNALSTRLVSWSNVDFAQVAPAVFLDGPLWPLFTPARAEHVLATPRGTEAWKAALAAHS